MLGRFIRLEHSRNRPGFGLGLSLVAAVARLHGGTLRLEEGAPGLVAVLDLRRGPIVKMPIVRRATPEPGRPRLCREGPERIFASVQWVPHSGRTTSSRSVQVCPGLSNSVQVCPGLWPSDRADQFPGACPPRASRIIRPANPKPLRLQRSGPVRNATRGSAFSSSGRLPASRASRAERQPCWPAHPRWLPRPVSSGPW